jgi:VanZ family protein
MASENGSGSVSSVPAAAAAKRFWRTVAIASLVLFLVGTHWPKLRLPEVEGGPASDKLIHFIAFALLAVPVWWTGWFSRLRWLVVAGVLFAIFDEITQELLPIDRFANLDDLLSDLSGLFASVSILASLRDTGGEAGRMNESMRRSASNLLLSKPLNVANLAVAAALGMVVLVPVGVLLAPVVLIDVKVLAIAAAGVGAAGGGLLALEAGTRATLRRVRNARTCPFCLAEPCEPPVCIACSKPIAAAMWSAPPTIALASRLRAAWLPSVRSLVALTALVALVHLVPVVTRPLENLEPITVLAFDLMAVAFALAWAIHGTRVRLDRLRAAMTPKADSDGDARAVGLREGERWESMPR